VFLDGLGKVARLFGPKGTKAKSFSDDERIVFWYQLRKLRAPAAGKRAQRAA